MNRLQTSSFHSLPMIFSEFPSLFLADTGLAIVLFSNASSTRSAWIVCNIQNQICPNGGSRRPDNVYRGRQKIPDTYVRLRFLLHRKASTGCAAFLSLPRSSDLRQL